MDRKTRCWQRCKVSKKTFDQDCRLVWHCLNTWVWQNVSPNICIAQVVTLDISIPESNYV